MASNSLATRRHHRRHTRKNPSSEEIETIELDNIPSSATTASPTIIRISSLEQV